MGLFLLLNSIDEAQEEKLLSEFKEDGYLSSKKKVGSKQGQAKLVIGQGGFGKVWLFKLLFLKEAIQIID